MKLKFEAGSLLAFGVPFATYFYTHSRTIISCGDSAELTTAAASLGVAHAPGYPFLTLLGRVFDSMTPGSSASGVGLSIAFAGSLATFFLYQLLVHWSGEKVLSLLGAWTLAFSYHFWLYSLVPEHSALTAALLFLQWYSLIQWHEKSAAESGHWLMVFALSLGFGFSHHHSVVFFLPAYSFILYARVRGISGLKKWALKVGPLFIFFFLLGFSLNLTLPIRAYQAPFLNSGNILNWERFIAHLTRRDYGTVMLTPQYSELTANGALIILGYYFSSLLKSFTPLGVLMGLSGLFYLSKSKPFFTVTFLTSFILSGPLFFLMARMTPDSVAIRAILERFLIPSFCVVAFFIGWGVLSLGQRMNQRTKGSGFLFILLPVWLWGSNLQKLNLREFDLCETYGMDLMSSLEPNALVLVDGDNSLFTLWYLQQVERRRPDLWLVNFNINAAYKEHLKIIFPDLNLPPTLLRDNLVRHLIKIYLGHIPIYLVGVPGNRLHKVGVMGNPYHVEPSGLALRVVKEPLSNSMGESLWINFRLQSRPHKGYMRNQFSEEVIYLYALARFNESVLYFKSGRRAAGQHSLKKCLELDPHFEPALRLNMQS
ncbi:MAG: hypothetical protein KCHDKBKB_02001 [Elusimicrobia bacterium]|nr:hypothetical protein [Elusimicrobiota bacterium]